MSALLPIVQRIADGSDGSPAAKTNSTLLIGPPQMAGIGWARIVGAGSENSTSSLEPQLSMTSSRVAEVGGPYNCVARPLTMMALSALQRVSNCAPDTHSTAVPTT